VTQERWANLPLVFGDRLAGIVSFGWVAPGPFAPDEVVVLTAVVGRDSYDELTLLLA
jgi:hypothetical protein